MRETQIEEMTELLKVSERIIGCIHDLAEKLGYRLKSSIDAVDFFDRTIELLTKDRDTAYANVANLEASLKVAVEAMEMIKGTIKHGYTYMDEDGNSCDRLWATDVPRVDEIAATNEICQFYVEPLSIAQMRRFRSALSTIKESSTTAGPQK